MNILEFTIIISKDLHMIYLDYPKGSSLRESLTYIGELDLPTQAAVRSSYEEAIHVTLWFSAIMAVFGLVSSVFIKEKPLPNKK